MLNVKGLSFRYTQDRTVLEDISLSLKANDILCLLGPNGTGKTTLLKCLLKISKFQSGEVLLEGRSIKGISPRERAKIMAYVPQAAVMSFPYEVNEVVLMGRTAHLPMGKKVNLIDKDIASSALQMLGISHLKYRHFNEISGGERQMVLIARAIAQESKILIMDEPTANLDYGNQVRMLKVIKRLATKGYGILMTSHFPDHAFLACNKVALLKGGSIIAMGKPEEIVTSENLTKIYGTSICVTTAKFNEEENKRVCIPIMD